jgi:hypothetical protein
MTWPTSGPLERRGVFCNPQKRPQKRDEMITMKLTDDDRAELARMGRAWGRQEAELQMESIENGHQRVAADWATGTYCGDLAMYGECALEAEAIIDASARTAYYESL